MKSTKKTLLTPIIRNLKNCFHVDLSMDENFRNNEVTNNFRIINEIGGVKVLQNNEASNSTRIL